jgi:hypothetical protein
MSFDSNDESRGREGNTLGVLVTEGQVPHSVPGVAAGGTSARPRLAGPLAGCVDGGVLQIGLGGGHSLHGVGRPSPVPHDVVRPCAGTADALHLHLPLVRRLGPARVLVHIGDRVHVVDYRAVLSTHVEGRLGATIGCIEVAPEIARDFVVLGTDVRGRVVRCADRPRQPQRLPEDPARSLIAADVFVFDLDPLVDCLAVDAADPGSSHDLCRDVLPLLVRAGELGAHVFQDAELVSRYVPR